jgi:hypothetical protein
MEFYSSIKEDEMMLFAEEMDGMKWNKPDSQISSVFSHKWNLEGKKWHES